MKRTKTHKEGWGFSSTHHSFDLQAWQKGSTLLLATILLKFSELMLQKFFIYSKQKIKAYWQTFQFCKPIYSSIWWSGEWCRWFVLISPTCAMFWRESFLQNHMVDSDTIMEAIQVVHYNLNVPYICAQYVSFTPSFHCGPFE